MTKPSPSRTSTLAALIGLAAFGACAMPSQAAAQAYYQAGPAIGEHRLLRQLKAQGFRNLSVPVLNRDVFVLDATSARGDPVRLIVSAFDGRILEAHPQRRQWTRIDPEDEEVWPDRRWGRHDRRWDRPVDVDPAWRGRRGYDWPHDDDPWARRGDPDEPEQRDEAETTTPPSDVVPRRAPDRVTVAPPPAATPRDPDLPVPTLKNPTIVKRSPTAIPKDPAETAAPKPPAISTAPPPGAGTRDKPRIIDMTPKAPSVETKRAVSPPAARAGATAATVAPATRGAPAASPPSVLDSPIVVPEPAAPRIPPATPE